MKELSAAVVAVLLLGCSPEAAEPRPDSGPATSSSSEAAPAREQSAAGPTGGATAAPPMPTITTAVYVSMPEPPPRDFGEWAARVIANSDPLPAQDLDRLPVPTLAEAATPTAILDANGFPGAAVAQYDDLDGVGQAFLVVSMPWFEATTESEWRRLAIWWAAAGHAPTSTRGVVDGAVGEAVYVETDDVEHRHQATVLVSDPPRSITLIAADNVPLEELAALVGSAVNT